MQGAQIGHSVERTTEVARHPASSFPFGLPGSLSSRANSAEALGKIGDVRAVGPLTAVLDSEDETAAPAVTALGDIGDSRALEPLRKKAIISVLVLR